MDIQYRLYDAMFPEEGVWNGIVALHKSIFGEQDERLKLLATKRNVLIQVALAGTRVVGYKIGYELDPGKFYSWLGGVDPENRKRGIASRLMEDQHTHLAAKGYRTVQTRTKNKWRNMLILNLQHGFDIIGTYTDSHGEPKIILEKRLV